MKQFQKKKYKYWNREVQVSLVCMSNLQQNYSEYNIINYTWLKARKMKFETWTGTFKRLFVAAVVLYPLKTVKCMMNLVKKPFPPTEILTFPSNKNHVEPTVDMLLYPMYFSLWQTFPSTTNHVELSVDMLQWHFTVIYLLWNL